MAEEVLRGGPAAGETGGEHSPGFEGMEALAQAIELGEQGRDTRRNVGGMGWRKGGGQSFFFV